jgi:uncharacterized membrane protein
MKSDAESSWSARAKRSRAAYKEIEDAWNRRPLSNRVASRRFRRRLVVTTYAGWLVIVVMAKLVSLASSGGFWSIWLVAIASSMVQLTWLLRRTYINAPQLKDAELDERLVQVRNQSFRTAYRVFGVVAISGLVLTYFALTTQPNYQGSFNALVVLFGVALLGGTLPTIILAWREPDPQTSEEST